MAGHSQFKNIMHRKGRQDAARSKLFSRLSKEITVAAKMADPDPGSNARLRLAVQNAKSQSMPKDNIERAINKASGGEGDDFEEIRYEGYGPGGVAIIVEAMTDNRNRTAGAIRSYFTKHGGSMGETGSVSFMFDRVGEIRYPVDAGSSDEVLEAAIEAGAEDVVSDGEEHVIYTGFEDLGAVSGALETSLGEPLSARPIWRPQTGAPIDEEKAATLMKLMSIFDEDEDVQNVYANFDIDDDVMERLTAA